MMASSSVTKMPPIDPYAWIERVVAIDPDRLAVATPDGRRFSYADLDAGAAGYAGALATLGVVLGDRVLVQAEKSVENVLLYLACLRMGAIFVPLNTGYTDAEIEYFLEDSDPRLVIVAPPRASEMLALVNGRANLATLGSRGDGSFAERAATSPPAPPRPAPDAGRLAAFLYTSGTTGRPKGAMLSCGNFTSNAAVLAESWRFTAGDVLLHALPLFHAHGLFVAVNTVLAAGASLVLMPRFDAAEVVARLPDVTVFMGVPTYYVRLLGEAGLTRKVAAGVRLFVSGSAPLLADTHRAFANRTGHQILERYGMTETLMNTSNPYDGARVPGTVGPPLPGIEVKAVSAETGMPLADGEVGMLVVRGPNLFKGYWRNPAKTAKDMRADGFFITGDLGMIDGNGYVHIVGRGKDLIISGGYNVYPREVEAELDALATIDESAVIGVSHADFGEAVIAVLVPLAGAVIDEAAVRKAMAARLARYKLPKAYVIRDALPRNAMGKVIKQQLRTELAAILTG